MTAIPKLSEIADEPDPLRVRAMLGRDRYDDPPVYAFRSKGAWLRHCSRFITGTNAAILLGCNDWKSRVELWDEKAEQAKANTYKQPLTRLEEYRMWLGNQLEEVAVQAFLHRWHYENERRELEQAFYVADTGPWTVVHHPEVSWAAGTPDRLVYCQSRNGVGVMEIKTTRGKYHTGASFPDTAHNIQTQHYLHCCGADWGVIVYLFIKDGKNHPPADWDDVPLPVNWWFINKDETYMERLTQVAEPFLENLRTGVRPNEGF